MPKLKFDWSPIKDVQKVNTLLARLLEGLLWRAARKFNHAIRRGCESRLYCNRTRFSCLSVLPPVFAWHRSYPK